MAISGDNVNAIDDGPQHNLGWGRFSGLVNEELSLLKNRRWHSMSLGLVPRTRWLVSSPPSPPFVLADAASRPTPQKVLLGAKSKEVHFEE
jgi:hypothetical protein